MLFQTLGRTQVNSRTLAPQEQHLEAMAVYNDGEYIRAHDMFLTLAQQGNVDAKAMLGVIYFHGHGVDADRVKSAIWFYQAARAGRAPAQLLVGKLFLSGEGVAADRDEAAFWLTLARDRGEGEVAENAQAALQTVLPTLSADVRESIQRRVKFWRPDVSDQETLGS
ncbi:MAG: tetratricopeptide repeat protein [Pseudomonadota bacterium]